MVYDDKLLSYSYNVPFLIFIIILRGYYIMKISHVSNIYQFGNK